MTTSGYNPTAMPAPETRHLPRIPDFTSRAADAGATDCSREETD